MDIFENLENLNVSEECFNDILNLVEEYINERNKTNRIAKKKWEMDRTGETRHPHYPSSKEKGIPRMERTIKNLQKIWSAVPTRTDKDHINRMANSNRIALGREQNPISLTPADNYGKIASKESRTEQSQRGSIKDPYSI